MRKIVILSTVLVVILAVAPVHALAQASAAKAVLKAMSDYVGSQNTIRVTFDSAIEIITPQLEKIQFTNSGVALLRRPDRLRAHRVGGYADVALYFDGKTVTLYNADENAFATHPAPGTIEEMFGFTRDALGLVVPVADLVYRHAYPLLMEDVGLAVVVGKAVIGGVRCDHLLFSRPGVDFQVWVADEGAPLPYKYVVTDTGTPARLSISTVMSNWNETPSVKDARFTFLPPKKAQSISFMPFRAY